jgi:4-cresol dehydrogenase (hydroxylating)
MPTSVSPSRARVDSDRAQGTRSSADVQKAIAAWTQVIGPEHVKADAGTRDRYSRTTGFSAHRPLAIVYPDSTQQVQEILRISATYGIGVYPISRGKNWGYGDAAAMHENQVILDLRRMNRIIEVNSKMAYVVIEPGVTQGQLYADLKEHKTGLWMDSSGAGLVASIVGNVLDSGFGHTRYGDHCLTTCGMEVVLADGEVLQTGLGHYPGAKAHRTYRYGIGPFLDGLFTQSNFGVVTQMGVWLMPEPEDFSAFFLSTPNEAALADLVDRLAPLRMQGLLQSTIHIGNDLRIISGRTRYPFERTGGKTPLPPELRTAMREEAAIGAWNIAGAMYGSRETVAATRKAVRRALKGYRVMFLNDRTLRLAGAVQRTLARFGLGKSLGEKLESVRPIYGLLQGTPTDEPMRGAGWRVRGPMAAGAVDPLDCHAGLLWIAPVLPASGEDAQRVLRLMEPIFDKYGFEALVTFTMITERSLVCVTNISFDRREADEVTRARLCYQELTDRLFAQGYVSYRTGPAGMPKLDAGSSVFWDVTSRIKDALDPQGIISTGRYDPRAA